MAFPINSSSKYPVQFLDELPLDFPHSPCSNFMNSQSSNTLESLIFPEQTDEVRESAWDAVELTAEEVDAVFRSLETHEKLPETKYIIKKRGRWPKCDVMLMASSVEAAEGDIKDKCHRIWKEVGALVGRNQGDCHKRYFKYLEEKELAPENSIIEKKSLRGVFTKEDVIECRRVIKKFNLVRKDGLLDVKRLSEYVDRAYTSLRYNIYQATHSVFCEHPFFVPFREKYRQIHHLSS